MEMVEEGITHPKITPKRIKVEELVEEEEEEDRISALPDGLLVEILSRLPSTESAIRTGTLSKRWKYLWTSVPTLIFIHLYSDKRPLSDFVSFVDQTLTQCRQSKLRKFEVNIEYDIRFESQVNNWIRYAISCNVEELDLGIWTFDNEAEFLLNEFFFINSCFTDLKLKGCVFYPTGAISWKRLKRLRISNGNLTEDLIENILSGSPLLETLVFCECDGYWRLGITSKSIKKLVFSEGSYPDPDGEFEWRINNWIGYAISCNVEELDLTLWSVDMMLDKYFFINSYFTDLRLSGHVFDPAGEISWKRLRSLCISDGSLDEDLIENILSGSPLLETLELHDCFGYRRLDITSKSVKKLVFSFSEYSNLNDGSDDLGDIIEINAPNILSLTVEGHLELWKLLLLNVSSLVVANLNFTKCGHREEEAEEDMLKGLIQSLRHVKELKIGDRCSQDAYKLTMLEKYEPDRNPEFMLTGSSACCNMGRSYVGSISEEVEREAGQEAGSGMRNEKQI